MNRYTSTILAIHNEIKSLVIKLKVEKDHMDAQHLSEQIAAHEQAIKILKEAGW